MPRFVFMDTETTGLHAARKPWEVALIVHHCADDDYRQLVTPVERYQWFVHPRDLDWLTADPAALEIGRFWERHPHAPALLKTLEALDTDRAAPFELEQAPLLKRLPERIGVARLADVAESVYARTREKSLICGSNPHFDQETMAPAMMALGLKPEWHYHPVDVPATCEGFLFGKYGPDGPSIERKSEAMAEAVGVDLSKYDRHTAIGDCELFYAAWLNVIGA